MLYFARAYFALLRRWCAAGCRQLQAGMRQAMPTRRHMLYSACAFVAFLRRWFAAVLPSTAGKEYGKDASQQAHAVFCMCIAASTSAPYAFAAAAAAVCA
jgi:type II secretory pathway component PulM